MWCRERAHCATMEIKPLHRRTHAAWAGGRGGRRAGRAAHGSSRLHGRRQARLAAAAEREIARDALHVVFARSASSTLESTAAAHAAPPVPSAIHCCCRCRCRCCCCCCCVLSRQTSRGLIKRITSLRALVPASLELAVPHSSCREVGATRRV